MTDKAVSMEASDILSLGSSFIPQNTAKATTQEFAPMLKANGDFQKNSAVFNVLDSITVPYTWSIVTGLGAALEDLLGSISGGYAITGIRVETAYNAYPLMNFTAHNHGANAHITLPLYKIPADMIALLTGEYGAYDFLGKAAADVCTQRATYEIACEHIDAECSGGDHWVGTNVKGREEATGEYIGEVVTPDTVAGWTVTAYNVNDSNEEFDSSSITAERIVARE